jgi:hypothetical protein
MQVKTQHTLIEDPRNHRTSEVDAHLSKTASRINVRHNIRQSRSKVWAVSAEAITGSNSFFGWLNRQLARPAGHGQVQAQRMIPMQSHGKHVSGGRFCETERKMFEQFVDQQAEHLSSLDTGKRSTRVWVTASYCYHPDHGG